MSPTREDIDADGIIKMQKLQMKTCRDNVFDWEVCQREEREKNGKVWSHRTKLERERRKEGQTSRF